MNGRTSKLIRSCSIGDDRLRKNLKALWVGTPAPDRARLRRYLRNLSRDLGSLSGIRIDIRRRHK